MAAQNAINNVQFSSTNVVTFTSNGTYTPSANCVAAQVVCVGGGGGGAGSDAPAAGERGLAGAGAGGGTVIKVYARSSLVPSVAVTIGSGGTGGAAGTNNGNAGGATTFLGLTASGGGGGQATAPGAGLTVNGALGGSATGGDVNVIGGSTPFSLYSGGGFAIPRGGNTLYATDSQIGFGAVAVSYGGGGPGGWRDFGNAAAAGNNGAAGIVYITEYLGS